MTLKGLFFIGLSACTLAAPAAAQSGDAPYLLTGPGLSVFCQNGSVHFYAGGVRVHSCVVSRGVNLRDTANGPIVCQAGFNATFTEDGRVIQCNTPAPGGPGGTPGGNVPGGGTIGGGPAGGVQSGGGPTGGGGPVPPWARSGGRPPILTPGEAAALSGGGPYTSIGQSSNRPGGRGGYLYLGDGRASATYTVQAPVAGNYALWIRFDDDGKHPAGARSVEISVNGAMAIRWSNESRETNGWVNIPVGRVDLRAGANTVVFTKAATTSAAFVMDEFVLSDQPGFVPQ